MRKRPFASSRSVLAAVPPPKPPKDLPLCPIAEDESPLGALLDLTDTMATVMVLEAAFPLSVLAPGTAVTLPRAGSVGVAAPAVLHPAPFPVVLLSQLCV